VASLCPIVNTHRMVHDYVESYYVTAHARFRALGADNARRARALAAAMQRIRNEWQHVSVAEVEDGPGQTVPVGRAMRITARVHLGRLQPGDVVVELYVGRVDANGELVAGTPVVMRTDDNGRDGTFTYAVETSIARSGLHGFTVRVRPCHPDMPSAFIPGLIRWAASAAPV
jgi:starch phosphorylase